MEREDAAARLKHEKEELLEELKGVRSGQDRSAEEARHVFFISGGWGGRGGVAVFLGSGVWFGVSPRRYRGIFGSGERGSRHCRIAPPPLNSTKQAYNLFFVCESILPMLVGYKTSFPRGRCNAVVWRRLHVTAAAAAAALSLEDMETDRAMNRFPPPHLPPQLREALTRAEREKEEAESRHRVWMRQAQARQTELEATATQLAEALAKAKRRQEVRCVHARHTQWCECIMEEGRTGGTCGRFFRPELDYYYWGVRGGGRGRIFVHSGEMERERASQQRLHRDHRELPYSQFWKVHRKNKGKKENLPFCPPNPAVFPSCFRVSNVLEWLGGPLVVIPSKLNRQEVGAQKRFSKAPVEMATNHSFLLLLCVCVYVCVCVFL